MIGLDSLTQVITATGGLGTAAFGVVDALKVFGEYGPNEIGFGGLAGSVRPLLPASTGGGGLGQEKTVATLRANWVNGTDLAGQKAIAKSLIKLNLSEGNAEALAKETGVDAAALKQIAASMVSGEALTAAHADVLARFDLIVTALLDEAYQRADRSYVNGTRVIAMFFAVALAVVGALVLHNDNPAAPPIKVFDVLEAVLMGVLATPLAPIAKDLSSALATAVNTLQAVKKA